MFESLYILGEAHGWYQEAVLELGHGNISGCLPEDGADDYLSSGRVVLGKRVFINVVPLPLKTTESVEISLTFSRGETLTLLCHGATLHLLGEPGELEELPEGGSGSYREVGMMD